MVSSSMAAVLYRSPPHVRAFERAEPPRAPVSQSGHLDVVLALAEIATARALRAGAR
jgi:hypothetical protein